MSKYKLKNWTIWIENKSKDTYHYVCDEENLVIVDSFKDYVLFIQADHQDNLILERLPYYLQYKISVSEKHLYITIL